MTTNDRSARTPTLAICITSIAAALALHSGYARADDDPFAESYTASTVPAGELEIEHYLRAGLNRWDDPSTDERDGTWREVDWRHDLEFELGATDFMDIGFYNVLRQKPYESLEYEGVKLRARIRFVDEGAWIVDPAIYLEAGYFGDEVKFEEMLILSRTIKKFTAAINAKIEQEIDLADPNATPELELILMGGPGLQIADWFAVAIEYYGKMKFEDGEREYGVSYLGPTLSFYGSRFSWNIAGQPQLGANRDLAAVRINSTFAVFF